MTRLRRKLPSANALFVFEAAARHGSFTRAAAELGVTQPAVSRMLARFESHLGVTLFERVPGGLRLTDSGELLQRRIAEGFLAIDSGLDELEARRTGARPVTLSVSTAFTTHWLMPRMGQLQAAFPAVDLRFQLMPGPIGGPVDDVDLGMRFAAIGEPGEPGSLVMPEIRVPVCSPAWRARDDGAAPVFIDLAGADGAWHADVAARAGARAAAASHLSFSDYAIVVQAALLGQGVALGWLNVVAHWLREGALVPAGRRARATARRCHLFVAAGSRERAEVRDLRDWIIAELRADLAAVDARHPELGLREVVGGSA